MRGKQASKQAAYQAGFLAKCAEAGVDPRVLIKKAQFGRLGMRRQLAAAYPNYAGFVSRPELTPADVERAQSILAAHPSLGKRTAARSLADLEQLGRQASPISEGVKSIRQALGQMPIVQRLGRRAQQVAVPSFIRQLPQLLGRMGR